VPVSPVTPTDAITAVRAQLESTMIRRGDHLSASEPPTRVSNARGMACNASTYPSASVEPVRLNVIQENAT
jgi:hypothetical protein